MADDARYDEWVKTAFSVDPASYPSTGQRQTPPMPESENIFDDIGDGLKKVGEGIVDGAKKVGEGIVDGAKKVGEVVVDGAKKVGEVVVDGAKKVGEVVEKGVKVVTDEMIALANKSYETSMNRLDAQIKAVKDAGLDATPYEAQAKSIRDAHEAAWKQPDLSARWTAVSDCTKRADTAADEAEADVKKLKRSAVEGVTGAIKGLVDGAKTQIEKLPKENDKKADLEKRLGELNKQVEEVGKITDRAEAAKKLKDLNKTAQKLFDDAVAASGDKSTVEAVYKKALEERYGFKITNPSNMPNTHLDQVYKMFDKVPEADVVQNKMQELTYQPKNSKGGKNTGAAYGGATIFMGDYGNENWGYKDPKTGKPAPANGFSISTLHELGHSVDDRFKIMNSNQSKPSAGGWNRESVDSVAKVFHDDFKAGAGKGCTLEDGKIVAAIKDALGGKGAKRPDGTTDPDWTLLEPVLTNCVSRRDDKWPWGHPLAIGGRAYHQAYAQGDQWWSYDVSARGKAPEVRDYQYRAPGEWFAELYAYSFYNETAPSGVDSAVAAYMYGGKSASEPSKSK
jgi:hypothetical protein